MVCTVPLDDRQSHLQIDHNHEIYYKFQVHQSQSIVAEIFAVDQCFYAKVTQQLMRYGAEQRMQRKTWDRDHRKVDFYPRL